MISRYIYFVLLICVASCAFAQEEGSAAKETGNFLVVSSMDGEQVKTLDAGEAQILWATQMDTADYDPEEDAYSYFVELFPDLKGGRPDSGSFVIKIKSMKHGWENEPTLLLYAQFDEGHLTKVYYRGMCESPSAWKAVDTYLAVLRENGQPRVKLDAVLETIKFGLACYIRHPYNEEGGYDDIHRYMRIHAEFEVPEDVFKLLGKAAEPEVKQVDGGAPVDTNDVSR